MPKMKTKSGAKKRFKVTASGKVKFKQAHSRHRLISKPQKMKRKARGTAVMFHSDGVKVLDYFMANSGAKRRRSKPYNPTNDNASATPAKAAKKATTTKSTATKKPAAAKKAAPKAGE